MTDPVKKVKDASQDAEAKMKTSEDHAEGKPSSEMPNKAKGCFDSFLGIYFKIRSLSPNRQYRIEDIQVICLHLLYPDMQQLQPMSCRLNSAHRCCL